MIAVEIHSFSDGFTFANVKLFAIWANEAVIDVFGATVDIFIWL